MSRKKEDQIEDYLALLFLEHPQLEGCSTDKVLYELNKNFKTNFTYRQVRSVYEPIIEFEQIYEEEEDFYDEF